MSASSSFEKVGECLYRNPSSGTYFARVKLRGKEIERSLETMVFERALPAVAASACAAAIEKEREPDSDEDPRLRLGDDRELAAGFVECQRLVSGA